MNAGRNRRIYKRALQLERDEARRRAYTKRHGKRHIQNGLVNHLIWPLLLVALVASI